MILASHPKPLSVALFFTCLAALAPAAAATIWPVDPAGTPTPPPPSSRRRLRRDRRHARAGRWNLHRRGERGGVADEGAPHPLGERRPDRVCLGRRAHHSDSPLPGHPRPRNPTVEGIGLRNGRDLRWGGAVVIYLSGSPIIRNCIISDSEAQRGGGNRRGGNRRAADREHVDLEQPCHAGRRRLHQRGLGNGARGLRDRRQSRHALRRRRPLGRPVRERDRQSMHGGPERGLAVRRRVVRARLFDHLVQRVHPPPKLRGHVRGRRPPLGSNRRRRFQLLEQQPPSSSFTTSSPPPCSTR